jgi:hypothetical protein
VTIIYWASAFFLCLGPHDRGFILRALPVTVRR